MLPIAFFALVLPFSCAIYKRIKNYLSDKAEEAENALEVARKADEENQEAPAAENKTLNNSRQALISPNSNNLNALSDSPQLDN